MIGSAARPRRSRLMRSGCHAAALALVVGIALAPSNAIAATGAPVRAEIEALLAALAQSGCEFNRNGEWHAADEARAHLWRKFESIEARLSLRSADEFIDLAATHSSASGRAYSVRCPGAMPVDSAAWLAARLRELRATSSAAPQSSPRVGSAR